MKNRHIILDASVIAMWLLPDEENSIALQIKNDLASGVKELVIPSLTYYEISSVLSTAVRRKRITEEVSKKLFHAFLDIKVLVYATKELFAHAHKLSIQYYISSYDASYVALAEYLKIPFYTADEKLIKQAASNFVLSMQEYLQ